MPYPDGLSFGPETRIVLIGTSTFADKTLPAIPHATRNLDHLSRLFKDPDICGLEDNCIKRIDDPKSIEEITEVVANFGKEATNTFLVYYVGHGLYGNHLSPLYLTTTKTTEDGKSYNGVPTNLVKDAIKNSPARTRILILDCCYSGKALEGAMDGAPSPEKAAKPTIVQDGTYGIAAVPADHRALAPPGETLTRFTGALVDVLQHGLDVQDKSLTLDTVFKAVEEKVRSKGDAAPPKHAVVDWASNFRIAFNRALIEPSLKDILTAITGIRETIKDTGVRVEAMEKKIPSFEELDTRLTATEAALMSNPNSSPTPANGVSISSVSLEPKPWWEYAGLEQSQWLLLPAAPYKLHIKDCVNGTQNGGGLLAAVCAAGVGLILLSLTDILILPPRTTLAIGFWLVWAMLALVCIFLFAALVRTRFDKGPLEQSAVMPPQHIQDLVQSNETFYDRMRTAILHIFGFPVRRNLVSIAVIVGLFSLFASVGILAAKQTMNMTYRVPQLNVSPTAQ
jgi:hypothetical protein